MRKDLITIIAVILIAFFVCNSSSNTTSVVDSPISTEDHERIQKSIDLMCASFSLWHHDNHFTSTTINW